MDTPDFLESSESHHHSQNLLDFKHLPRAETDRKEPLALRKILQSDTTMSYAMYPKPSVINSRMIPGITTKMEPNPHEVTVNLKKAITEP